MSTADDAQPEVAGAGLRKGLHPFFLVLAFLFAYPLGLLLLFFHPRYGRSKAWWWLGGIWSFIMFVGWMNKGSKPEDPAPQASTPQVQGEGKNSEATTVIGVNQPAQQRVANHDKLNAWTALWEHWSNQPTLANSEPDQLKRSQFQQQSAEWWKGLKQLQQRFISTPFDPVQNPEDANAIVINANAINAAIAEYKTKDDYRTASIYEAGIGYVQNEIDSIASRMPSDGRGNNVVNTQPATVQPATSPTSSSAPSLASTLKNPGPEVKGREKGDKGFGQEEGEREVNSYKVEKGRFSGSLTVEIPSSYGIEFSDFERDGYKLKYTVVWHASKNRRVNPQKMRWIAYDSKGVNLEGYFFDVGNSIKSGEPTKGHIIIKDDLWKKAARIVIHAE